ncbi:hypothetical protein AHAS_Ahas19G0370700 [Arachis hypogaea]
MATESYRMEFKRYFLLVWFDKAVEKYKLKGNKTCEGCMFVMLGHLLTRQGEGEDIKGRSPQAASRKPGKKAPQKRGRKDSVPPRGSSVSGKSKQVASERRPSGRTTAPHPIRRSSQCAEGAKTSPRVSILVMRKTAQQGSYAKKRGAKKDRSRRSNPKQSEKKDLPMSTDDDEENEPLAKRMYRLADPTKGNLNQDNAPHETPVSRVPDAGTPSVALVQHEWEFDGQVHPLLKGRKLDEDDEERLRRWAANGLLVKRQVVASYEGRQHLSLVREDICSLLPQRWVNSNETVLQKRNLDSFREVPTVSYVGLGPHFSDDSRFFDKIAASMQKWWFAPVCIDRHWWLYTFEIAQKRLWVLDSMYSGEHNNERLKIHAYAGRIIEDMAKVSMPAYEPMEKAYLVSIPASQNNITGRCDCGVFVIKFMQFWSLEKPLQLWDKDVVQEFWKEIILDIVMSPHNSQIGKALQALDSDPVRRNQPRKKTKAVRSPFTAPSTKSMLQRAGLPTRKPNKGEDNGRRHMPSYWNFKHCTAFGRNQSTWPVRLRINASDKTKKGRVYSVVSKEPRNLAKNDKTLTPRNLTIYA